MGCAGSKVDDLPAVALCRDRCHFLEEAIRQRYAFSDAHVAYIHSLKGIGLSLHRVFDQDLDNSSISSSSPLLPLPTQRKGDPVASAVAAQPSTSSAAASAAAAAATPAALARDSNSNSNSGSHIHFHSDSDDDDDSGSLHHHSGHSSPLHHHYNPADHEEVHPDYELDRGIMGSSFPGGFMNMNFMRNRPTASVSYEQRPMSPDIVRVDESSSSYYPPYPYPNHNAPAPNPYYAYPNYDPYAGSSYPPPPMASSASSSRPPPPPPSPPRNSPWDFLNPFETFESYYPPYTPSRDSKEVRDEEGIPDLEYEDSPQEVVKQVHGDHKFVDGSAKKVIDDEDKNRDDDDDDDDDDDGEATHYQTRPSVSSVERGVEYDVHLVDKNVVVNEERSEDQGNVATFKARVRLRGASEVVAEIKILFERAAESGSEVSTMLEAGKLPYHRKNTVYQGIRFLPSLFSDQIFSLVLRFVDTWN